uniref:OO_Ba0005L10-OO_Ba0081K17.30 protein n=1 Tax=Oryza officinalis TaxID=4535 RepID=D0ABE1_9ORYZ|nr:OO_Ba0005L10-OO_Ba0081K17.30 [Oryza officinalis]
MSHEPCIAAAVSLFSRVIETHPGTFPATVFALVRSLPPCRGRATPERDYTNDVFVGLFARKSIHQILSRLPINDAIRTSVLSRKWKYVRCSHTNLTLNKGTMRKPYVKTLIQYRWRWLRDYEFITRVDAVLRQHNGMGVQRMEIKFRLHSKHADHIDRWVNFAIASKTKEIVVDLSGQDKGSFFTDLSDGTRLFSPNYGSYLRCLEHTTVSLQLPADFKGFVNLKSLSLVDMSITDEDVQCMLSKCNLLEFLEISYCRTVTSIRMLYPLDRLKHLVVDICPILDEIELNCSPTTLKYNGDMVPLKFASTSRLTNISILLFTGQSALSYIVTGFPTTLSRLETLTLLCKERERTIVPEGPFKFTYLRNLRLELVFSGHENMRNTDVLDYAYLLKIAPFMKTLELSMWMNCRHQPYHEEDEPVTPLSEKLKELNLGGTQIWNCTALDRRQKAVALDAYNY